MAKKRTQKKALPKKTKKKERAPTEVSAMSKAEAKKIIALIFSLTYSFTVVILHTRFFPDDFILVIGLVCLGVILLFLFFAVPFAINLIKKLSEPKKTTGGKKE